MGVDVNLMPGVCQQLHLALQPTCCLYAPFLPSSCTTDLYYTLYTLTVYSGRIGLQTVISKCHHADSVLDQYAETILYHHMKSELPQVLISTA